MTKKILIFGTAGNCIDILEILFEINEYRGSEVYDCLGFLDDDEARWGTKIYGIPILGPLSSAPKYNDSYFLNGIGSQSNFWKKHEIIAKAKQPIEKFETVIHPSANISRSTKLGFGTVIFQNVTINSNAYIGNQVEILPNSVISHDDVIGDYCCIASGVCISGDVTIGQSCYLGTNAAIINNVTIGDNCLIGMGSVVLENIPENSVVVGSPARFLRETINKHQKSIN